MCKAELTAQTEPGSEPGKNALLVTIRVEGTPDHLATIEHSIRRSMPPKPDASVAHSIDPFNRKHTTTSEIDIANVEPRFGIPTTPTAIAESVNRQMRRVAAERDEYRERFAAAVVERREAIEQRDTAKAERSQSLIERNAAFCEAGSYRERLELARRELDETKGRLKRAILLVDDVKHQRDDFEQQNESLIEERRCTIADVNDTAVARTQAEEARDRYIAENETLIAELARTKKDRDNVLAQLATANRDRDQYRKLYVTASNDKDTALRERDAMQAAGLKTKHELEASLKLESETTETRIDIRRKLFDDVRSALGIKPGSSMLGAVRRAVSERDCYHTAWSERVAEVDELKAKLKAEYKAGEGYIEERDKNATELRRLRTFEEALGYPNCTPTTASAMRTVWEKATRVIRGECTIPNCGGRRTGGHLLCADPKHIPDSVGGDLFEQYQVAKKDLATAVDVSLARLAELGEKRDRIKSLELANDVLKQTVAANEPGVVLPPVNPWREGSVPPRTFVKQAIGNVHERIAAAVAKVCEEVAGVSMPVDSRPWLSPMDAERLTLVYETDCDCDEYGDIDAVCDCKPEWQLDIPDTCEKCDDRRLEDRARREARLARKTAAEKKADEQFARAETLQRKLYELTHPPTGDRQLAHAESMQAERDAARFNLDQVRSDISDGHARLMGERDQYKSMYHTELAAHAAHAKKLEDKLRVNYYPKWVALQVEITAAKSTIEMMKMKQLPIGMRLVDIDRMRRDIQTLNEKIRESTGSKEAKRWKHLHGQLNSKLQRYKRTNKRIATVLQELRQSNFIASKVRRAVVGGFDPLSAVDPGVARAIPLSVLDAMTKFQKHPAIDETFGLIRFGFGMEVSESTTFRQWCEAKTRAPFPRLTADCMSWII